MDQHYKPSGELQGDTRPMPDRGTGTGGNANPQTLGMSIEQDAVNRINGIGAKSDPAMKNMPCNPDRK
ncbi:MAG: hypothetical protein WC322_03850 [Candidatus Paceibacterota bacterium]|jgi:hypothetical protein